MKIFKQTFTFILLLSILFLGGNFLIGGFEHAFADWYGGIPIKGEENMVWTGANLIDPGSIGKADSNDEGVKIISGAVYYVVDTLKLVLYAVALIYIIIAALNIITAQGDESKIKSNRETITFALFGFIIILLADTAVTQVFYGGAGVTGVDGKEIWPGDCLLNPKQCATQGASELLGLVYWGRALLTVIAVIEIIVSGIRMIMAIGDAEVIEKEKKVFIWVGIGLLLLAINEVVINKVLYITEDENGNPNEVKNGRLEIDTDLTEGINQFVGVIQFILMFVAVFAVVSLIYGGFLMVMNFGDDENVTKAKGIIRDAIIGVIVAISSYAIVSTIIL